ncbi:hypothetical protein [Variovorax rhizosphaerae]|uniref:Uncharacterized protein n=1 Tax=Variovorax rhizosphaerae TaxID=1836200 RepID=A0ABU8WDT9_9BURK
MPRLIAGPTPCTVITSCSAGSNRPLPRVYCFTSGGVATPRARGRDTIEDLHRDLFHGC